jgi:hypothetical protein
MELGAPLKWYSCHGCHTKWRVWAKVIDLTRKEGKYTNDKFVFISWRVWKSLTKLGRFWTGSRQYTVSVLTPFSLASFSYCQNGLTIQTWLRVF